MFKSDTPFSPKKLSFYYGWLIVPAAIVGVLMSLPGQTAGFSAFTNPIIDSLGISRSTLAISYFLGTITSGFILPKAGKSLDKYGTRPTVVVVALCFGLVLTLFSCCQELISFITDIVQIANPNFITIPVLALLILGIRFFGQGMLPMISNTMIGRWFDKKRGKVVAVMGMVNSLVFNAAPYLLLLFVQDLGWQLAWRYLAIIVGGFFLIFSWVFFRDNPESCGLVVDGLEQASEKTGLQNGEMTGVTVEQAKKNITFKALVFVLSLYGMTITGITFHLEAIGTEAGLSKEAAMAIFVPVSFITIPVGFLTAWLTDRVPMKKLIITLALVQATAYLCFAFIDSRLGYALAIIFLGISGGMYGPIFTISFPWYFGRLHLGAINGKVTSFMVIFSAIGPLVFSFFKDISGAFSTALYFFALLPIIGFFLCQKMLNEKMY